LDASPGSPSSNAGLSGTRGGIYGRKNEEEQRQQSEGPSRGKGFPERRAASYDLAGERARSGRGGARERVRGCGEDPRKVCSGMKGISRQVIDGVKRCA